MKMACDGPTNDKAKEFFELLCDLQILLGIVAILPLLEAIHNLIKFSQLCDVFVYDFVATTKVCQGEIFELYTNWNMRFKSNAFASYKFLC
jgi:hypothetical protein